MGQESASFGLRQEESIHRNRLARVEGDRADFERAEKLHGDQIIAQITSLGFADKTRDAARSYLALASQALAVIPECLEKNLLGAMIDFVLTRDK